MEKTGCKIICGAPTTLAIKGLMMMLMMICVLSARADLPIAARDVDPFGQMGNSSARRN